MSAEDQLPWDEFVALELRRRAATERHAASRSDTSPLPYRSAPGSPDPTASARYHQGPFPDALTPAPEDDVARRTAQRTSSGPEQRASNVEQRFYGRNPYPQRVCSGTTLAGGPCRSFARSDGDFCQMHDPSRADELREMRRQGGAASAQSRALRDRCARLDSYEDLLAFNAEVLRAALDEAIPTPLARLLLTGVAQHRQLLRAAQIERDLYEDDGYQPVPAARPGPRPADPALTVPEARSAAPEAPPAPAKDHFLTTWEQLGGRVIRPEALDATAHEPASGGPGATAAATLDEVPEAGRATPAGDADQPSADAAAEVQPELPESDGDADPPAPETDPDPPPEDDVDALAPSSTSTDDPLLAARLRARAKLYRDVLALQALDPEFLRPPEAAVHG